MVGSTLGVYSFALIFVSARTNKRHHQRRLPFGINSILSAFFEQTPPGVHARDSQTKLSHISAVEFNAWQRPDRFSCPLLEPSLHLCVFYFCRTYYKAVRVGGGGEWRTCAMRDDEPRPVWMSLPITHFDRQGFVNWRFVFGLGLNRPRVCLLL
jgi:hypothetical protein